MSFLYISQSLRAPSNISIDHSLTLALLAPLFLSLSLALCNIMSHNSIYFISSFKILVQGAFSLLETVHPMAGLPRSVLRVVNHQTILSIFCHILPITSGVLGIMQVFESGESHANWIRLALEDAVSASLNDPRFASRLAESAGVVGKVNCSALRFCGFNLAAAWPFKT